MSPFATPTATSENFVKPIVYVKMMKMKVVKMRRVATQKRAVPMVTLVQPRIC